MELKELLIISATWAGEKPGIDGQYIYIKFNQSFDFKSHGYLITDDWRSGVNLIDRERSNNDLFIGVLVTSDSKNSWVPQGSLQKGSKWYILK